MSRTIFFPSDTLIDGISRDSSKNFKIRTWPAQHRTRQTKCTPAWEVAKDTKVQISFIYLDVLGHLGYKQFQLYYKIIWKLLSHSFTCPDSLLFGSTIIKTKKISKNYECCVVSLSNCQSLSSTSRF